jgi:hypothetical protein
MQEVRAIYRCKELVCAEDRSLFRNNADAHLAKFSHSSAIINWVAIQAFWLSQAWHKRRY